MLTMRELSKVYRTDTVQTTALDAIDLVTGKTFSLDAAQCAFGYRDSVFKHSSAAPGPAGHGFGLADKALITRVRFALPKAWKAVLGYADIEKKMQQSGIQAPEASQIHS